MQMDGPIELRTAERGTRGRNRAAYVAEALVEYFISLLVAGAFLAMILKQTGVPDSVTGVTTALSSLAFMGQLVSALFIRTRKTPRRFILWGHLINQLMFVLLYAIPFIHIPQIIKIALFVCMYLGGHLIANMVAPFKLSWLMSYVDDRKRGLSQPKRRSYPWWAAWHSPFSWGVSLTTMKESARQRPDVFFAASPYWFSALRTLLRWPPSRTGMSRRKPARRSG